MEGGAREPTIGGENSAQEEQLDARSKVAIIFQRFDKDQDGFLNFAEFKSRGGRSPTTRI